MTVLYKRADIHMNELTQDSHKFRPEKKIQHREPEACTKSYLYPRTY